MKYRDMNRFRKGHPPSPYEQPVSIVQKRADGTIRMGEGVLPDSLTLRTVGWIEGRWFRKGRLPDSCIAALVMAHPDLIFSDGFRGVHTCTLCGTMDPSVEWEGRTVALRGHGHYLVRKESTVFMAPELLLHYVLRHRYCPPEAFRDAVAHGSFMTEQDLVVTWRF